MAEPNITVDNIADAVKIIDLAANEGVFKGWDVIRQVLMVRDLLDAFVTAANRQINTSAAVLDGGGEADTSILS